MERCIICNSLLSENNTTGIGFGCMNNIVKPAIKATFNEVKGLDVWVAKVDKVRTVFLDAFKEVKFRSEFKKSFYESMANAERISKNQLQIMENELAFKGILIDLAKEVYFPMFNSFNHLQFPEIYQEKLESFKVQYFSRNKVKAID